MANRQWRILLVEDDPEDYLLTKEMLMETKGARCLIEWTSSYEDGLEAILGKPYDAILLDYQLGAKTGLDLVRDLNARGCRTPIILLTGRGNYDLDIEAMHTGVTDYLSKAEATPSTLERSIRYAMQQKQNEEALLAAKADLETRVRERTAELTAKNEALEAEVAERKRMEGELAEMQRRLLDRAETERLQLARDLHDGPMQDLYGLVFQLEGLPEDFAAGDGRQSVASMKERMLSVIESLRSLSRELRPPALAPYGLEKAIRSHAEALRQAHPELAIDLQLDLDGQALPESTRMALFRIYQTAISNVLRHARASQAWVTFRLTRDHACLEIQDNGRGFDLPKRWITLARQGHMGLVGALERAEAAGGALDVVSTPGEGTRIRVTVPR